MATRRSRSEAEIEAQLKALEPGSKRYNVLVAVRDFKASWVQVGSELTEVRENNLFRNWGYTVFETYCRRELHIKTDTANKLTRSFSFVRDHEPDALEQRTERELPPLDVVDLLSQARDRAQVSSHDLKSIQREVFDADSSPSKNQVVKRFREIDPDAFKPAPKQQRNDPSGELRRALLLAERLLSTLDVLEGVSKESLKMARSVVAELKGKLEEQRQRT
ncbi:MAG: hypothetical protein A2289_18970 [Deltaproteobacteria bacterium RIFOXYA12_FULL_58_15]|nr:MAG: hypothetical protein A2289_18970 [Deltaproteobacteria bacterium RIFOXYA12_FULL_58_15]OGR08700.1 MAG: hypothetical protein A2341_00715 [Deltaproteobacteria bacterium RIFOXYB12_FULL_58_9]